MVVSDWVLKLLMDVVEYVFTVFLSIDKIQLKKTRLKLHSFYC